MAKKTTGLSTKFHSLTNTGGTYRSVYVGKRKAKPLGKTLVPMKVGQPAFRPYAIHRRNLLEQHYIRPHVAKVVVHRKELKGMRNPFPFNPQELRAIPKSQIRGTLPERIFYKTLINRKLVPMVDFTFQSSLDGGRLYFGGMVLDFMFPKKRLVVQIQGPTHAQFLRAAKDERQAQEMADMGYVVLDLWEETIMSEAALEMFCRRYIDMGQLPDSTGTTGELVIDSRQMNI